MQAEPFPPGNALWYGDPAAGNRVIRGDNLAVMDALLPEYAGCFRCIYIDPPYNTGAHIRTDDEGAGYADALEHAAWLAMMRPRLERMRDLLAPDGTLVVQIDDNEYARLFLLMAELFGERNLKTICVKMAEPTGVKMAHVIRHGRIPKLKEYLIVARKDGIRDLFLEKVPKARWDPEYKYLITGLGAEDIETLKQVLNAEDAPSSEALAEADVLCARIRLESLERLYEECGTRSEEERSQARYDHAWRIVRDVATSGSARRAADIKRQTHVSDFFVIQTPRGRRYLVRGNYNPEAAQPRIRLLFADEYLTVHPGDFWQDIKTTGLDNEGGIDFRKGKKPEALIRRIIGMATRDGDWVLDAFAGSGTTGAVAIKMRRRCVLIETAEHCETHLLPRLSRVVDGEDRQGISALEHWQGGSGFRYEVFSGSFEG